MPDIFFVRSSPRPDGVLGPATGHIRFRQSKARTIVGAPDNVVTPEPFTVPFLAGVVEVTLAPTTAGWAWRVDESVDGIKDETYYVTVPDVPGPLDDPDLPRVNPGTLAPAAAPQAAWWAVADATITGAGIVGDDLVLTRHDGTTVNAGRVTPTPETVADAAEAAVAAAATPGALLFLADTDGRPYFA